MTSSQAAKQAWEYARLTLNVDTTRILSFGASSRNLSAEVQLQTGTALDECLGQVGENAWELVAVVERGNYHFIFKRLKP